MTILKKILIVYTNSGAGHRRAAEAIYQIIGQFFPDATAKIVDTLDYSTAVFRKTYPQTYLTMVNRVPWFWGWMYHFTDTKPVDWVSRYFRRLTNGRHCRRFEDFLLAENPDLVITTHFLPNEIISRLKKHGKIKTRLVTCITDYYPHAMWLDSGIDLYVTPDPQLTPDLVRLGVEKDIIKPFGIPIDLVFNERLDRKGLLTRFGLNQDQFTILIASGGFGIGPVEELVDEVLKIKQPCQLIVVCGNNAILQKEVSERQSGTDHNLQVYGFVNNMHELMEVADIMITKSGGLTTTEALAKHLPMIILYPIPGQELSNCEFVVGRGAGWQVKGPSEARSRIERLLEHPDQLNKIKQNLEQLGRPEATREILAYIKKQWG